MADGKKTKAPSSSSTKVTKGKKKSATQSKKTATARGSAASTNVVQLAEQKKKKIKSAPKIKTAKKKVAPPARVAAPKEAETTLIITPIKAYEKMEKMMTKANAANPFDKLSSETMTFGKDCSDACTKSGKIFMKGFEEIVGTVVSLMQSSAEKNAKLMKEALSSKTLNEFAEVQNKMAQSGFDDFMSSATKLSEMSVKILSDATEPVNSHITKAVQKATESIAA